MREWRMGSVASELFSAVFLHRRRVLVLTLPTLLVGATAWVLDHFALLPSNIVLTKPFHAYWWLWVIAVLTGLVLSLAFAWVEQFKAVKTITGRPDVTL